MPKVSELKTAGQIAAEELADPETRREQERTAATGGDRLTPATVSGGAYHRGMTADSTAKPARLRLPASLDYADIEIRSNAKLWVFGGIPVLDGPQFRRPVRSGLWVRQRGASV